MAFGDVVQVAAPSAKVATGNSGIFRLPGAGDRVGIIVPVTASSGTPNVVVSVQWSPDGVLLVPSDPVDVMTALTVGTPGACKVFDVKAPWIEVIWTVTGGSPSMTFGVYAYVTL